MNLPKCNLSIYKQVMDSKQAIVTEIVSLNCKQAELKQQLVDIDGFLRTCRRILPEGEISTEAEKDSIPKPTHQARKPNKQEVIATAAKQILSDGHVLHTNQILERLAERGISVPGKNPSGNLSAMLSKTNGIINSRAAKGWMLSPQGNHYPERLMEAYPLNKLVNSPANEGMELVERSESIPPAPKNPGGHPNSPSDGHFKIPQ